MVRFVEATQLDGSTCSARVKAIDFESGIAVVAVDASWKGGVHLHPDDDLALGEDVFLVASVGDGRRVNSGTVSSIGLFEAFWEYELEGAITVTADNPGLPGGPLFDRRGRMVGVVALSLAEVGKPTSSSRRSRTRLWPRRARSGRHTGSARPGWGSPVTRCGIT
jgi:S1-C subfamily serine protease